MKAMMGKIGDQGRDVGGTGAEDTRFNKLYEQAPTSLPTICIHRSGRQVSNEIQEDVSSSGERAVARLNSILGDPEMRSNFTSALAGPKAGPKEQAAAEMCVAEMCDTNNLANALDTDRFQMPNFKAAVSGDIWSDGLKAQTRLPEGMNGALVSDGTGQPEVYISADLGFRDTQITAFEGIAALSALYAGNFGLKVSDQNQFNRINESLSGGSEETGESNTAGKPWPNQQEIMVSSTIVTAVVLNGKSSDADAAEENKSVL